VRRTAARSAVEAVWRIESGRLIAALARMTGDVGLAEDLAQDALLAALEHWPRSGVPENPGAWLTAAAKNRAIDLARRGRRFEDRRDQLIREAGTRMAMDAAEREAASGGLGDDLLGLIFACCHPLLSTDARVALTLRLLGGLSTEEIARAFLIPEPTVSQRIVRAKRTLREAGARLAPPEGEDLDERLPSVLEVVYLIFNEGYAATAGESWMRLELCDDALRLGRVLVGLVPLQSEAHGLVALMEIQASRARARIGVGGGPVLLPDQDRSRWDPLLVRRGLAALDRAERLGRGALGPYTLQAAIAACHARARAAEETDWVRIAALYGALVQLTPSPVVELNRAVAVARAFGPEHGLELVDALVAGGALDGYHLLPSVRGDLLEKLGRAEQARAEFERAAGMTANAPERELLLRRARDCADRTGEDHPP
jgi:RNA polymerase sigma factor (sigma-70 family)